MATTNKSIIFQAKNVKAFTAWLKRFSSIENTLLLEIDEKTSSFLAKSYNDERSVVKMSSINFDDAGLVTKPDKDPKRVKVGIFNISVDCTSINIFKYIPDDLFKNSIATIQSIGEFELSKANIEKLNSLCVLDNEHKFMEFKFKDNEVLVTGKTFELTLGEIGRAAASINIFKDQYANIDIENYNVQLGEDRLVFNSKDSDTTCVISQAIDN